MKIFTLKVFQDYSHIANRETQKVRYENIGACGDDSVLDQI